MMLPDDAGAQKRASALMFETGRAMLRAVRSAATFAPAARVEVSVKITCCEHHTGCLYTALRNTMPPMGNLSVSWDEANRTVTIGRNPR